MPLEGLPGQKRFYGSCLTFETRAKVLNLELKNNTPTQSTYTQSFFCHAYSPFDQRTDHNIAKMKVTDKIKLYTEATNKIELPI